MKQTMDLITIFNYPTNNENYTNMCNIWLHHANQFKGDLDVRIFTQGGVNEEVKTVIEEFGFSLETLTGVQVTNGNSPIANKTNHNVGFKLFNLCKQTTPFVFVDADAFILEDMNTLVKLSDGQRFIGINHEKIPRHTEHFQYRFLNSGVQVVNDPTILVFDEIIKMKMVSPGTDQSLLFSYFKHIDYDYTNPNIGFEWNSFAHYVKVEMKENKWVATSTGLDYTHPVYINHYWNPESKPWEIDCPIYKKYLEDGHIFVQ